MKSFELVIFDLDGVIVSTDQYHYQAWQELAIMHNLYFDKTLNQKLRGVSRAESLHIILKHNHRSVSDELFNDMLTEKNEMYKELLGNLSKADILPGVTDFIKSLKKSNIKIAIGSSSKNTPLILQKIGIEAVFDEIVDGNQISKSKPDPEVFEKGAKRLNVANEKTIVIEDAVAGIAAAKACNMIAIGVSEHELEADLYLKSLEHLTYKTLIEKLGGKIE